MALGEPFVKPTAMLYRSLLAIQTEESLRCHPVDGAVLMGGCDKTMPGLLLGAISMGLPSIFLPSGPMLTGRWRRQAMGSGTDTAKAFLDWKAGLMSDAEFATLEEAGARSPRPLHDDGHGIDDDGAGRRDGLVADGGEFHPCPRQPPSPYGRTRRAAGGRIDPRGFPPRQADDQSCLP